MITFTVLKDPEGRYRGFRCQGHAGYADSGQDIICAAVSVLVTTIGNALEAYTGTGLDGRQSEGLAEVTFQDLPDEKAQLLMDTLIMGIEGVISASPKGYVKILEKEVR